MENRKTHIVEQAGQLFLRHGIKTVTMDDVASELGISKKTLYLHFKDKKELVNEVVTNFLMQDEDYSIKTDATLNAIDRVIWMRERIFKMMKIVHNKIEFDLKKTYSEIYKKVSDYKRNRIFEDNISILKQGKEEGLFRDDFDEELIAKLSVGRILLVFNPEGGIFSEEEIKNIDLFDKMLDYHFHGICTNKGLDYYKKQLNKVQKETNI